MSNYGNNDGHIPTDALAPSRVIAGKYHLGKVLGEGGMGSVYEAEHRELGAKVAVKLLSEASSNNPKSLVRFRREAKVMGQIRHENVISVMDAGTDEMGTPFLVMELLEGESLAATLRRERVLSPGLACWITSEILAGLGAAHAKGVVHRDLKPGNVFIATQSDGSRRVKLLDFGISKLGDASATLDVTAAGALVGTPNFMAPEQIRANVELDGRIDVYATGIMLYRMVTGELPYLGKNAEELYRRILEGSATPPRQVREDIPVALEEVIMRAMAPVRENRYQTAHDFQDALQAAIPIDDYSGSRQRSATRPASLGPNPNLAPPPPSFDGDRSQTVSLIQAGGYSSSPSNTGSPAPIGPGMAGAPMSGVPNTPIPGAPSSPYGVHPLPGAGAPNTGPYPSHGSHLHHQTMSQKKSWPWIATVLIILGAIVAGVVTYTVSKSGNGDEGENSAVAGGSAPSGDAIVLGVTRHKSPEEIAKQMKSFTDYLGKATGHPIELMVVDNYEALSDRLVAGEMHMAALSASQYVKATRRNQGIRLLATPTTDSGPTYGAYILARANSGISTLQDLVGKRFCYTSETSSSGYLYPRAVMRQAGINPDKDLIGSFRQDHVASLRALEKGACDGAAVYDKAWIEASEHGLDPAAFTVVKATERVPWDAYCVTDRLDTEIADELQAALVALELDSPLAKEVLVDGGSPFGGFLPGNDSLYDPVRSLEKYLNLEAKTDAQ